LQVKEPAQAKLPTKLGAIQAVLGKAQKAILRNDFEFHAKTVAEVRDITYINPCIYHISGLNQGGKGWACCLFYGAERGGKGLEHTTTMTITACP
jgi:hypothetical protein